MKWEEIPVQDRLRIVMDYNAAPAQGRVAAITSHAETFGMVPVTMARRCRDFNQYMNLIDSMPVQHRQETNDYIVFPPFPNTPRLTDIERAPKDTDVALWLDWLYTRASENPVVTVMHPCDIHFPFHDEQSMRLYYKLLEIVQPDLTIEGSDCHDFYGYTTFESDPDVASREGRSALKRAKADFTSHITKSRQIAPKTERVWIWGNHERRLIRSLLAKMPEMRDDVMELFTSNIQATGTWYIGEFDHVRMGPIRIEHGVRHGNNPIAGRLKDEGYQVSIWQGHVHKEASGTVRGADFTVKGITSGALCDIVPHYMARGITTQAGQKWTNGTVIATFNLKKRAIGFEQVTFENGECIFRGKVVSAE